MRIKDIALLSGLSYSTILRYVRRGKLNPDDLNDVADFVAKRLGV